MARERGEGRRAKSVRRVERGPLSNAMRQHATPDLTLRHPVTLGKITFISTPSPQAPGPDPLIVIVLGYYETMQPSLNMAAFSVTIDMWKKIPTGTE